MPQVLVSPQVFRNSWYGMYMSEKLILVHVLKAVKKMDLNRSDPCFSLMLTCRNSPLWQRCEHCKPTLGRAMMVSRPFQNHSLKQKQSFFYLSCIIMV